MAVDESGSYKGLRIGKANARVGGSDAGMSFDGMYWHYIDKFIFAVCRYAVLSRDSTVVDRIVTLIKQVHPHFLVKETGYLWKINVDCSPIPGVSAYPNHDALTALIVYRVTYFSYTLHAHIATT